MTDMPRGAAAPPLGSLPPPPGPVVSHRPPPRWGVQKGLIQPRQFAFWLFVVAIVLGTLYGLLLQLASLLIAAPVWLL